MKKIFLLLFLLLLPITNAYAYSDRYFNIELPSDYKIHMENIDTFQWINEKEGSNVVLSISLKPGDKDISEYDEKETSDFVDGIIKDLETQYYKAYEKNVDVELIKNEDIKVNGYKGLLIETKIEDFLSTGNTMNQYINVFESKNFLYSLVYSTGEKTYNEEDFNAIKKSFKILDEKPINKVYNNIQYILNFISLGLLIFFGVIVFRRIKDDKK